MTPSDESFPSNSEVLFLSAKSKVSGRSAVFEDDGFSGWLYLTAPHEQRPVADCFVYSRVPSVGRMEPGPRGKNGPPLLTRTFASMHAVMPSVCKEMIQIRFSDDGESVAVWVAGEPWAFIVQGEQRGYSRSLAVPGPFGHPWSEERYREAF